MGPKIEAAVAFLAKKGGSVLITDAKNLKAAVDGKAGTRIVHEKATAKVPIARKG
jgi:carbamate kinase